MEWVNDLISGMTNLVSTLKGVVQNLATINSSISAAFPRITGSFTLTAAATTVVNQSAIKANSLVILQPTNAAAGTLMGSAKAPYIAPSSYVAGTSFTVATASGASAAGTETFNYTVINPS